RDYGVRARRRLAVMGAWFERHIERGAVCNRAGAAQRLDLGMRPATGLRPAAPDNVTAPHEDRADRRIRPCSAKSASTQRQCERHISVVIGDVGGCNAAGCAHSAASSPDNSASAVSKSFASRKLRYTEANRT